MRQRVKGIELHFCENCMILTLAVLSQCDNTLVLQTDRQRTEETKLQRSAKTGAIIVDYSFLLYQFLAFFSRESVSQSQTVIHGPWAVH